MSTSNNGFWQMRHEHLAALLACSGLSWETVRVYLALGDLTRGYGKPKDCVSIDQIGKLAHTDHRHTARALVKLSELGLYRESKVSTRKTLRWVVWPAPSGLSRRAPVSAKVGTNSATKQVPDSAKVGTNRAPKRTSDSALGGTNTKNPVSASPGTVISAKVGTHQDKTIKKERKGGALDPAFGEFWKAYPRRVSKQQAQKAWQKLKPDQGLVETILAALEKHKLTEQWQKGIIPHASTWLNQRRWEDEIETPEKQAERQFLSQFPPMKIPTAEEAEALLA